MPWQLDTEIVPGSVITNTTGLFDRVEIWRRAGDPMAVGVIERKEPRYFSIVRWGDAEVTLEQAKRMLRPRKMAVMVLSDLGLMGFVHFYFRRNCPVGTIEQVVSRTQPMQKKTAASAEGIRFH